MIRFLSTLLLACCMAKVAWAESVQDKRLEQVWAYLEALSPLTANFMQQDPDGKVRRGWLAVSPPRRARIEYEPPDSTVLVADGSYLVYHNSEAGQTAHFALDNLPLRVLFEGRRPAAEDNLEILSVTQRNGFLSVRIAALDDEEIRIPGWVELVFMENPFSLAGWRLLDVQQRSTVVILDNQEAATFTDRDTFRLSDDMIQRGDLWRGPWKNRRAIPTSPRGVR